MGLQIKEFRVHIRSKYFKEHDCKTLHRGRASSNLNSSREHASVYNAIVKFSRSQIVVDGLSKADKNSQESDPRYVNYSDLSGGDLSSNAKSAKRLQYVVERFSFAGRDSCRVNARFMLKRVLLHH